MGVFALVITPQLKCSVIILNSSRLIFQILSSPDRCCSTKYTPWGSGALLWNLISNSEEGPVGRVQSLSCVRLCNPMNHSTAGLPVHHQLLESTQTHVHFFGDVIQPSHPLSSPSFLPSIFPSIRVISNESVLHNKWPKY